VRKFLSRKIAQLNDIIADMDGLVTEMGFEFYRVCIFGSARIKPDTEDYRRVRELAYALAARGVDIVTGGGPGLMEAANVGAKDGANDSRSIGLPIQLAFESDANSHLDVKYHHRRFSSRLDEFMRISHAVVVTPGGIGTLLELLYTWQLLQVGHTVDKPLILLGGDMWSGFLKWMREEPLGRSLMNESDFEYLIVCDTVDEVMKVLDPKIAGFQQQFRPVPPTPDLG
jgi:uncharacterized protein (TIGR00730 family)